MPNILIPILIFMLGASFGSFLSVVIYRLHEKKKGIVMGHSICPKCKFELEFIDMIPVMSYVFLRGKCRQCKKPIPSQYLLLELTLGLIFLSIFLTYPFLGAVGGETIFDGMLLLKFLFTSAFGVFFIAILFYDLRTSTIPDVFLFPLIGTAIVGSLLTGMPLLSHLIIAPVIAAVFFGGQIVLSKGKWLGEGDFYFGLALAVIFGWQLFIVCIAVSYFIGALVSITLLLAKKADKKTQIPFGPFLVIGALATMFFGNDILNWYVQSVFI